MIRLAENQLALKRISDEIKTVKRKVNSLEYLIIPKLKKNQKNISFRLNELERENFARLKLIKAKIS
jgi:V/A-type H+-transporting ATPase subunit D